MAGLATGHGPANMLTRIVNLVAKELIQFRRDRLLSLFIILAPALQLLLMARAVESGIRNQPVALLDLDRTPLSRQLAALLDQADQLSVRFYVDTPEQLQSYLDRGQARLAVIIPSGFAEELSRPFLSTEGDPFEPVALVVDGTNVIAADLTLNAATNVVQGFAADLAASQGLSIPQTIDLRTTILFNPTLDIRDFTIPAQLGFIVYQVTLAMAALTLARERELGTLEQLMVTPVRRVELALGKGLPALAIGELNFAVLLVVGVAAFHIPMNGSALLLAALTLLFVVAVVSWGLVISAVSRTQQQAILFVFIQAMVDMTFSGFLVPVKNMPAVFQVIARFIPLQYYLSFVRNVMVKGAGWQDLWPQALALAGLSLAMALLAFRVVARRVE